ncbi:MAG: NAD(P)H-binding protein [Streptococcaceae bacterium]|jgi:putative NADH-flavin reductase|nr:NAD(P)H-binding protein [Streptococcaceae bacterium]
MENIIVLGATGNVAQEFIRIFEQEANSELSLSLFARRKSKLPRHQQSNYPFFEGDMYQVNALVKALENIDTIVSFVGSSPMPVYAKNLLSALEQNQRVKKIIWLGAGGMNFETTGREGSLRRSMSSYFDQQLKGAQMLVESKFITTIISPVIFHGGKEGVPIISDSSQKTPVQSVSRATVARVFYEAVAKKKWENQMITVGDKM